MFKKNSIVNNVIKPFLKKLFTTNKRKCSSAESVKKRKRFKMKTKVDLEALQRELTAKITLLNSDTVFINNPGSDAKINKLRTRLEATNQLLENYEVFSWFFDDDSGLKRLDLVNQDR